MTSTSNIFVGVGIYVRNFGASFELPPDFIHLFPYEVSYLTTSLSVPVNIGYFFVSSNVVRAGVKIGLENCVLLDQKGKRPEGNSEIGIYKDYLVAFVPKLSLGYKVNQATYIVVEPYWFHQLNKNNSPYKQLAFGCDIGLTFILKGKS